MNTFYISYSAWGTEKREDVLPKVQQNTRSYVVFIIILYHPLLSEYQTVSRDPNISNGYQNATLE